MKPLLFITISSIILCILLLILIFFIKKRNQRFGFVEIRTHNTSDFFEKLYFILIHFWVTRRILNSIMDKLNLIGDFGITQLRAKSVQLFLLSYIPLFILFLTLSIFIRQIYVIVLIVIAFSSVASSITEFFINNIISKLLEQMIDFNEELRKKYLNSLMIDEALYSVIESMEVSKYKEIIKEASKIYDILTDSNGEYKLNQYYLSAPNKYLKLLAGICFITKEYGDTKVEGGSLLVRSITQISNELRNDVLFRNRLNVGIKSLNIIVLMPIFFIYPLRSWASKNFFPMAKFYDGSLGFIAQMSVLTIVVISFRALKRLQRFNDETKDIGFGDMYKGIYKKYKNFIRYFIPNDDSKLYHKKRNLLEKAMVFERIEYHYTKKIVYSILFGVIGSIILISFLMINKNQILKSPVLDRNFLGGELSQKSLERATYIRDVDNSVIEEFKKFKRENVESIRTGEIQDIDIIKGLIAEKYEISNEDILYHANRIQEKIMKLERSRFNFIHVLIIYFCILIGYFIPDLNLVIMHGLIKIDMVSEVVKFQIIVSILVHVKNMDVETLLEWFERFSYVYRKPIQKTLMEFDSGAISALEKLKNSSDYYEFQNIIQHLISCVEDLSLQDAFGEFEDEKQYYAQKRYDENLKVVESKINIGRIFGFLPIYGLIILYFIVPLIYVSVNELKNYFLLLK